MDTEACSGWSRLILRLRFRTSPFIVIPFAIACSSLTGSKGSLRPSDPRIVTSDIPNFWISFDAIKSASDTAPLRRYIDSGTEGLRDFTNLRWKNSKNLTAVVWARRAYYASIRSNTLSIGGMEPEIRQVFSALDAMIDNAIFPDVYFCIGAMSSGGTTSANGLLIGAELFSVSPETPFHTLSAWQKSVVRPLEVLPAIVAHELVHYQQKYSSGKSLLGQAIREGSADFLGQLISGRTINETMRAYGDAHEAELWAEFKTVMNGTDVSNWLYNGGSVTPTSRPADLGYYIGARIAEAYYVKASDKRKAVKDILNIEDFPAFLSASGYNGR